MRVRMMRQVLMQAITNERAHGDVDLNLTHQLAVVHDAGEQTGEHQPYRYLGIDAGPRSSSQSQSETSSQPRQVEHAVDAYQHVVIRNELPERPCDEELRFMPLLAPEHIPLSPTPNH